MTFEQLQTFIEVYQLKSITRAADNLYISRQAVSASIQKLEEEFDIVLFTRYANKIEPTHAGTDFYQSALELFTLQAILTQKMRNYANFPGKETIKIGIPDVASTVYGDELAEKLATTFPQTKFSFIPTSPLTKLSSYDEYDLFFACTIDENKYDFVLDKGYGTYYLLTKKLYVWLSADSPLSKLPVVQPKLLKDYQQLVANNVFNLNFTQGLYFKNATNVKIKSTFADYIENGKYCAYDCPLNRNRFFYEDILKDKHVVLKEINQVANWNIIYKKSAQMYLPIIAAVIHS